MKIRIAATLMVLSSWIPMPSAQQPQPRPEALDGIDTVLLLKTGKETFGKAAFKSEHGRFTYLFASAESKAEFDANPDRYAVQLDGVCARMGGGNGNPSDYAVVDGKIYLFASDACHKAFVAAPQHFLPRTAAPMPSDPAAESAGRASLDRAAVAHGGAALDSLKGYAESYVAATANPMPSPPKVTTTWQFPDGVRAERSFTMGNRSMTIVTLLTGGRGWNGPTDAPALEPIAPAGLPPLVQQAGRALIPLLRTRTAPGTRVAALGRTTIDGVEVERVRLQRDTLDVTVNITQSGRVHSTTSVERGPDGSFGELIVRFADFRDTAGVAVPYAQTVTFEGAAAPTLSHTLQSASINPVVDPALFKGGDR